MDFSKDELNMILYLAEKHLEETDIKELIETSPGCWEEQKIIGDIASKLYQDLNKEWNNDVVEMSVYTSS